MNASAPHSIALENGSALLWPGGDRGVLLLHGAIYDAASWEAQAQVMSSHGYTVLALEDLSSSVVLGGIDFLMNDCGAKGVVVIGASAGGAAALNTLSSDPDGIAGLILLSATGEVKTLGDYPKLFIASKDEGFGDRLQMMAENAPGDQNETLILPGSAHAQAIFKGDQSDALLAAILAFLDQDARWEG
ncbi:MAG: alpha/beta hydrolase [Thermomicrobiales bacterium]